MTAMRRTVFHNIRMGDQRDVKPHHLNEVVAFLDARVKDEKTRKDLRLDRALALVKKHKDR
jgi:hypothetical protein